MLKKSWQRWQSQSKDRSAATGRTYIVPTWTGVAFAVFLFLFLLVAFFYDNNLIFAYVFILVALGLLTMWLTNRLVEGLKLDALSLDSFFLDEAPPLKISITAPHPNTPKEYTFETEFSHQMQNFYLTGHNNIHKTIALEFTAKDLGLKRGLCHGVRIKIFSQSPLHLFESWRWLKIFEKTLIKPSRVNHLIHLQKKILEVASTDKEWSGFEDWNESHDLRNIHWKSFLRTKNLIVNIYNDSKSLDPVIIDWETTAILDSFEERIEQISYWIHLSYQNGIDFEVHLPNQKFSSSELSNIWQTLSLVQQSDWTVDV